MTGMFSFKPHIIAASLLATANSLSAYADTEGGEFFGNLRTGFITAKDDMGEHTKSSAIGGKWATLRRNGMV